MYVLTDTANAADVRAPHAGAHTLGLYDAQPMLAEVLAVITRYRRLRLVDNRLAENRGAGYLLQRVAHQCCCCSGGGGEEDRQRSRTLINDC